ncbi:hypothetical protein WA026_023220 [Henosepilachna vigintioctopunctata]|uniref:Insulin-like domain-containing protein n=1 Tax=Henosepilachna vigintioctopunctata TaxID=420089 RepID=A0AAW1VGP4_9CUCU
MRLKLLITLAVFCILVNHCSSSETYRHYKRRFCGNKLVDAISLVCNKRYNSPSMKKSVDFNQEYLDDNSVPDYFANENQNALSSFRFLDRSFEDDNGGYFPLAYARRMKKGIYEECCLNPCTEDDLKAYCYIPRI